MCQLPDSGLKGKVYIAHLLANMNACLVIDIAATAVPSEKLHKYILWQTANEIN